MKGLLSAILLMQVLIAGILILGFTGTLLATLVSPFFYIPAGALVALAAIALIVHVERIIRAEDRMVRRWQDWRASQDEE